MSLMFPILRFKPLNYCLQRNIGGFMEELIEVIQGLKQPGCIDYIQLGSAIVSVITSIIAVLVAIGVPKTIAENQNKIALFEKRYELFQFYRKCQSFLYAIKMRINNMKKFRKFIVLQIILK